MSVNKLDRVFSVRYGKRNLKFLYNSLKEFSAITICAFSGVGITSFLKFVCKSNFSGTSFRNLTNFKFIYIDLPYFQKTSNREIQTYIIKKILKSISDKETKSIGTSFISSAESISLLEDTIESFHKKIYLVIDNFEYLLNEKFKESIDFINYLRDHFRGKLEIIFAIGEYKLLNEQKFLIGSKLGQILNRNIYNLKLLNKQEVGEMIEYKIYQKLYDSFKQKLDLRYKSKLDLIYSLSGGYPPYIKYFKENGIVNYKNNLALNSLSQRIFNSLNSTLQSTLISLVQGNGKLEEKKH